MSLASQLRTRLLAGGNVLSAGDGGALRLHLDTRLLRFGPSRRGEATGEQRRHGAVSGRLPQYEVLVTASLSEDANVLTQTEYVAFARNLDAALYAAGSGRLIDLLIEHEALRIDGAPRRLPDSLSESGAHGL